MKGLCEIEDGEHFFYGGVEWVKLYGNCGGTLSIAAESVFERAFDEKNCNDFNKSSLRRELNGAFLDWLINKGADLEAFLEFASDLTADDGSIDYGESINRIALLTCDQYREYRGIFPKIGECWWTLTPWTCNPESSFCTRGVTSSGTLNINNARAGKRGVRPLCKLDSDTLVYMSGEEESTPDAEAAYVVEGMCIAILDILENYPSDFWGDALGAAVASVIKTRSTELRKTRLEGQARHK